MSNKSLHRMLYAGEHKTLAQAYGVVGAQTASESMALLRSDDAMTSRNRAIFLLAGLIDDLDRRITELEIHRPKATKGE